MIVWTPEQDARLRDLHGTMTIAEVASAMGTTRGSIRARITRIGIRKKDDDWTEHELSVLQSAYENAILNADIGLRELAAAFGRSKQNICRKARTLGLTDVSRKSVHKWKSRRKFETEEELRAAQSAIAKERIRVNGHPRGMAGKQHSDETKERLRQTSTAMQKRLSAKEKAEIRLKAMRTSVERYGRIGPAVPRGSWKAGWREIGGKRKYFRSRWEANYARYLQWLKERGEILDWQHEPETFWFEAIKRGVRSYLPDFRVWENDGTSKLHEVKGWMDSRSKTALSRMKRYHPQESIIVIRERDYKAIMRAVSMLIEGWECDGNGRVEVVL